jgi:uncharacterized protein (TIGR03382 family)
MKTTLIAAVAATLLTVSISSMADLPPPDGYVETCLRKNVETPDSECVMCMTGLPEAPKDRCAILLNPYCYTSVCMKAGGAWAESWWCRTKSADAPVVPDSVKAQLMQMVDLWDDYPPRPSTCAPYTPPEIPDPMAGVETPAETSTGSGCSASASRGGVSVSLAFLAAAGLLLMHRRGRRSAPHGQ